MTMYYLYLTTHDANGALRMNKLIWDAGMEEHRLRERLKQARNRMRKQAVARMNLLPTLGEIADPPPIVRTRPSREDIAEVIVRRVVDRTLTKKQLYEELADEPY